MKILDAIEMKYNTDALIIGGGPAGVCAAIAAARSGVSTVLVEEGGFCGGMATRVSGGGNCGSDGSNAEYGCSPYRYLSASGTVTE